MIKHLADLAHRQAETAGDRTALVDRRGAMTYADLADLVGRVAAGYRAVGLQPGDRVAIYLDKQRETVAAMLGCLLARCVFVPVNPVLKQRQLDHILRDSGARLLVTSRTRWTGLADCESAPWNLEAVALVDGTEDASTPPQTDWATLIDSAPESGWRANDRALETDLAAIFYTSGSTGQPKGVVLTNRNLLVGALSVAEYLGNTQEDVILAALPLSFDAGFSQLSTGLAAGASIVLHNYLLARDVPKACARHAVTGLTAVPPLWFQLVEAPWDDASRANLRYFANTGGHMPRATLQRLRRLFPNAAPYLMYGLTEAFRSTYLPPAEVDRRPDSIGKAIPNAEILVVGANGARCGPGEVGELVHRGPLVAHGYWNDPERTARRFRPAPATDPGTGRSEIAVWSGDLVKTDAEGFLYFVGRSDDMIKTMGYRVSPAEVEEIALAQPGVAEAAAFGVPHPDKGQAIILALVAGLSGQLQTDDVVAAAKRDLPNYMIPTACIAEAELPRNANGKIDRKALSDRYKNHFTPADSHAPGA